MRNNWEVKRLSEVCEVFDDGDWIESKDQSPEGVRLIQTGNVGNGFFKDRGEKARYISEATFKRLRCTEIFEGDCLVSRLPDPVGRACILPDTGERMITAVDCTIIRFDSKKIIPEFFNYFAQSRKYLNDVEHETTGTTRKRISRKGLGAISITVPPLAEQQRIVAILDEAFAAIGRAKENAEKNLQNARELFDSYLQSVFANPGDGWEVKTLGEIATFRNGINFTKGSKGETIKIVGVKDFQKNFWIPFESLESATVDRKLSEIDVLQNDDILAVRSNGNPELIGRTILADNISEKTSHSGFTIRIRLNSEKVFPQYLCHYMKSQTARKQLVESGTGINIKSLNQVALSSLVIPVPPFSEQKPLVRTLETLLADSKKLENIYRQKINNLDELKKSILQKAFNGELQ